MKAPLARVLVVEDEDLVAMNDCDALAAAGYIAERAASLRQAWQLLEGTAFDLLVLDHDLGDGTGLDLLGRLETRGVELPVVYLSADAASLGERVRRPAVRRVLSKPVAAAELSAAVADCLPRVNRAAEPYPRLINAAERRLLLDSWEEFENA